MDVDEVVVLVVLVLVVDDVEVVAGIVVVGSNVSSVVDTFVSLDPSDDEQAARNSPRAIMTAGVRRFMGYIIAESDRSKGDLGAAPF